MFRRAVLLIDFIFFNVLAYATGFSARACWIDREILSRTYKKFAAAVLSVYKRTDLVPADPAIDSAVLESVRIALCGVGLGRPVPPEHALGDSNSRSSDTVKG